MNEFEKQYKYTCSIELVGDIEEALKLYLDRNKMKDWHDDLDSIEETDNFYQFYLVFLINNQKMKMKVNILEFDPPHYAKTIYEMPSVWNLCVDKFEEIDGKILWTMDVEFRFEKDQHLLIDAFIRKTYLGMNIFKNYFENIK